MTERRDVVSPLVFRLVLALPALGFVVRYILVRHSTGDLLDASGEWAARLLIATLAVTPVRYLLRLVPHSQHVSMWLMKRRRDLGVAAFLYALFHMGTYAVRQWNIHVILYDLPFKEYLAGWTALVTLLVLALTSNDAAVHAMGVWWKRLQRLSYLSAIAVYLHWLWIRQDHTAAVLHFLPLVLLEAYRLWHDFARPGSSHPRR